MKYLVWTRRVVLVLISSLIFVAILVASIFWMMSGVDPVEGDTYSTPESNVAGTIIIFGMIIVAWVRSTSKKESQDTNTEQLLPPDTKIPD